MSRFPTIFRLYVL